MTPDHSLGIPSLLGGKLLSSLSEAELELATSAGTQEAARANLDARSYRSGKEEYSMRKALAESLKNEVRT